MKLGHFIFGDYPCPTRIGHWHPYDTRTTRISGVSSSKRQYFKHL